MRRNETMKKTLIVVTAYVLCVATLLTLLFSFSYAKYKSLINGYTRFNPKEFNGAIFDDASYEALSQGSSSVQPVGNGVQLTDCYPGMEPREYPFVIANGKDLGSFATVDVSFTLKVRSMLNIPLEYKIVLYSDETRKSGSVVYDSVVTPKRLVRDSEKPIDGQIYGDDNKDGKTEDTYWYEYTFLEGDKEKAFVIPGGEFEVRYFSLQVTWPIDIEKNTNSSAYRKEVEVIQLIAALVSENYQETDNYGRGYPEYPIDLSKESKGALVIDPDHVQKVYDNGTGTVYTYGYTVSYRSFKGKTGSSNVYEYNFNVNNGNGLYKYDSNGTRILNEMEDYTYYKIRMLAPYDSNVKSYTYKLYLKSTVPGQPDTVYTGKAIEYRKYDLLYDGGEGEEYEVLANAAAADALYAATGDKALTEQYAIYCVYDFEVNNIEGVYYFFNNGNRYDEENFTLEVSTGSSAIKTENDDRFGNYRLQLQTIAVYSATEMGNPVIPDDYLEWGSEGDELND